jgi:hypothetical protein
VVKELNLGDVVYITQNRKLKSYVVVDDPTPRRQRYKLESIDGHSIQLHLDPDNPLWRYVFTDIYEAARDVRRQEEEMEAEVKRRVHEWANQNINTPECLIRCLYTAWQSLSFSTAQIELRLPDSDMPEVQIARDEMKQLVIEGIRRHFGVDVSNTE